MVHLHAEARRVLTDRLLEVRLEGLTTLEQLVELRARDVAAGRQLRAEVDRITDRLVARHRATHVHDAILGREREAQRDLVARHQILARDGHELAAQIELAHRDGCFGACPEDVEARLELALESTRDEEHRALVFGDQLEADLALRQDLHQLGRRMLERQPRVETRERHGRVEGPTPVDTGTEEHLRNAVAVQHTALVRSEGELDEPVRRDDRSHLGRRLEEQLFDRVAEHLDAAEHVVSTWSEGALGLAVTDEHRALMERDVDSSEHEPPPVVDERPS